MMDILLASAIACLALGRVIADTPPAPAQAGTAPPLAAATDGAGPRIQFAEPIHDFGKVDVGAVVRHAFVLTNTGTE